MLFVFERANRLQIAWHGRIADDNGATGDRRDRRGGFARFVRTRFGC